MNRQEVVQTALRVSIVAGILCIAWLIGLYATGQNPYGPKRLMSLFVPPFAALIAQWRLRRYYANGSGLWRSLACGMLTVLLTALMSATAVYGLGRVTGPALIERNRAEMKKIVRAERKNFLKRPGGKEQYEQTLRNIAATPQSLAMDDFSKKLLLGVLLAVPGAIFFRQ